MQLKIQDFYFLVQVMAAGKEEFNFTFINFH